MPTWQPPNFESHTVYRSKDSKSRLDPIGSQTVFTQLKGRRTCPHRRPMIPSNSIGAVQGLSCEDVVLFRLLIHGTGFWITEIASKM